MGRHGRAAPGPSGPLGIVRVRARRADDPADGGPALPTALSARAIAVWAAAVVAGLLAVALSSGSAKLVAGIAAAVAATNALVEVWRADRVMRAPPPEDAAWWRRRELRAKARARVWTLLAGALTLAALARDDGAGPWDGVAIAAGVIGAALGAVLLVAVGDARAQRELIHGVLGTRVTQAAGVLLILASVAALVVGSW